MKHLLIFVLLMVAWWIWRQNARKASDNRRPPERPTPPQVSAPAVEVVACRVCQVHLPRSEALLGPTGAYCSAAHRRQAEP